MADLSESIDITCSPTQVYGMVSDLPRMGEWSPENRGARWFGRPAGPAVGAKFVGVNRFKWLVWPTNGRVTEADPGRAFSFEVVAGPVPVAFWEYRIAPTPDGCTVTESWTDRRPNWMIKPMNRIFGAPRETLNTRGIQVTLAKLKQAAEHSTV
ncbi:Polyketide cyclase / dehydrase and lipid transport [Frankineae bacterium MT45]|nr:Polyketide cyclase / dehydrase and lipid transport [Frankineae bacterium MT45]